MSRNLAGRNPCAAAHGRNRAVRYREVFISDANNSLKKTLDYKQEWQFQLL
jgi:hypothetical protein